MFFLVILRFLSRARAACFVGCLGACGCTESPVRGFEDFYEALADGETERALGRLTGPARQTLAAAAAPRGLTPGAALGVTFPKTTLKSITVLDEGGDQAVLEVTDVLGKSERVWMIREDGRWKIDAGDKRGTTP